MEVGEGWMGTLCCATPVARQLDIKTKLKNIEEKMKGFTVFALIAYHMQGELYRDFMLGITNETNDLKNNFKPFKRKKKAINHR